MAYPASMIATCDGIGMGSPELHNILTAIIEKPAKPLLNPGVTGTIGGQAGFITMRYGTNCFRIDYYDALRADEANLKRWLTWALKHDPGKDRIQKELDDGKTDVICALVWIGAISI